MAARGGRLAILAAAFAAAAAAAAADEIDPLVKASAYGDKTVWSYHDKNPVPWSLFKPKDYGSAKVAFDGTGVRSVGRVPPGGVHPRIFFSPEDLPEIRRRIKEDRGAAEAWKNLLCYANAMKLTYDEKADYAQPDWMKGGFRVHGRVQVFRVGGYDPSREDYYGLLAAGKRPEKTYDKESPATFFKVASLEALRCLVEDDAAAARRLAAAVTTCVKLEQERRAKEDRPVETGQPPKPSTPRLACANLGLIYDFIFNWMTPEERRIVHDELVTVSAWHDNYGTFNDAEASRSNWACFNYWVWDLLALHGEEGFNDLKFLGLYRGWRNFYTYSFFDTGAAFEGEGKLLFGLDAAVAMDRIAPQYGLEPLTWHPLPRRHYASFTASAMLPSRGTYAVFDVLGGMGGGLTTPGDLVVAKYLFPQDRTIDFVYRRHVGDDYRNLPSSLHHIANEVITSVIFATAYDPGISPESLGLPLTFFCGQRALLMTRSSWETDATMLTMHVRGASGGHPYRDRNGIMLAGQGRTWATIPGKDVGGWAMDTVVIDGAGQNATTPGRCADFVDGREATFMVGDAKHCWDWIWSKALTNRRGEAVSRDDVVTGNIDTGASWWSVEQSFNDFAWTKSDQALYGRPLKFNPDWLAMRGRLSPVTRQVNTPVIKSFRTAGLVRGKRPYVLVVDDVQRDPFPARYDWNLTLPDDVVRAGRLEAGTQDDVILVEKGSLDANGNVAPGRPALLVRMLECRGERLAVTVAVRDTVNLLSIATHAVAPDFKVLLCAFRTGDPLPMTSWDADRRRVTITFPGQKDEIAFAATSSGKTDMVVTRGGTCLAEVTKTVAPLDDPETARLTARLEQIPKRLADLEERRYDPLAQGRFVGGWRFDSLEGGVFAPLPGSMQGVPALKPGEEDRLVDGPAGRQALAIGRKGLTAALPPGDPKGESPWTVAAWFRTKPDPRFGRLLVVEGGFSLSLVQGNVWVSGPGNRVFDRWPSSMFSNWTHVVLAYDGELVRAYRNGMLLSTVPATGPMRVGGKLELGGRDAYDDAECSVAGVAFYATSLSPEAVADLYFWERYRPAGGGPSAS